MLSKAITTSAIIASVSAGETLIFEDNFDTLNFKNWQHEITMGGGGNWEFEMYVNNRTNSFVKEGVLHIQPTFTADFLGSETLMKTGELDLWGASPAD